MNVNLGGSQQICLIRQRKPYGFATYVGSQRQLRIGGELADWTDGDPATYGDSI